MITRTMIQIANLGFLIGIIFITFYWFKTFSTEKNQNSTMLDLASYGIEIFSAKYFTEEGNRYRKKYWYATLITLFMLFIPWAVRCFR